MILMPIVAVTSMERSRAFYQHLGFSVLVEGEWWSELRAGDGAVLALHLADAEDLTVGSQVELAMVSRERLENVVKRLASAGVETVVGIDEQPFGRSLRVVDPDGLVIQINEHDPAKFDDGFTAS
jgi:catechol-2,3-dioxygenase